MGKTALYRGIERRINVSNPKISVIIPVYNAEEYLEECLNSVLGQSMKEIEVICINDGSTENSLNILKQFRGRDERVHIISQDNESAGAARNRGLEIARGEYLSFLDADDFFESHMLSTAYEKAKKYEADIVVFRSNQFDEKKKSYCESTWTIKDQYIPNIDVFSHKDVKENFFDCFIGWTWDKLFRTKFIRENNIFFQNQKSINDLLFVYSALSKAERISIVQEILVHKRINNSNSISTNYSKSKTWTCFYQALLGLKKQLIQWGIFKELERDYINYALKFSLWNLGKFKNTEVYENLYNALKNEWFKELGVTDYNYSYFYDRTNYERLKDICSMTCSEYERKEIVRNMSGMFLFPFELVDKFSKIVLYGAGKVGCAYYRQIQYTKYCEVTAWVDRDYEKLNGGIENPDIILQREFDYVVIAINDKYIAEDIIGKLRAMGIDEKRIIWRSPQINENK